MEQDPHLRQMSREENAAYRGVTVAESGAEPQDDAREQSGEAYSRGPRTSVRYVRIGGTTSRPSLLTSFLKLLLLLQSHPLLLQLLFPYYQQLQHLL